METKAPSEWFRLAAHLQQEKGVAILLGATDTGKSTLAKFLISELCPKGLTIGLVDADIGQSFLGPPATIGMSLFKSDPKWGILMSPPELFFVGSTTPEGHLMIHLKGVKKMLDKAIACGPDVILIDTTGFVSGEGGRELKRKKIDLTSPRFILALQRGGEIEPILEYYRESRRHHVWRLPVSEHVRPKSVEERRANRTNKFRDYFKHSSIQEVAIEGIHIEGEVLDPEGLALPLDWALKMNSLVVGLKDENDDTLALGLIKNYSEKEKILKLLTPLREIERVKTIQLSSLRLLLLFEGDGS